MSANGQTPPAAEADRDEERARLERIRDAIKGLLDRHEQADEQRRHRETAS
jgi:hypothetical protein